MNVSAPGFGAWVTSQPGVGIFTYSHEVTSLPAPAAFRVLVRARWLDRHRSVIRRRELVSPLCAEPLETANLVLAKALTRRHAPGASNGNVVYGLEVLNAGTAAAGTFEVSLTVNGAALPDASVTGLAAGATALVQFTGPRMHGRLDPDRGRRSRRRRSASRPIRRAAGRFPASPSRSRRGLSGLRRFGSPRAPATLTVR